MKRVLVVAIWLMSLHNYAQVNFEKGYTIDNEIENKSTAGQTEELGTGRFLIRAKAGFSVNSLKMDSPDGYIVNPSSSAYTEYKYPDFKFDSGITYNVGFNLEYIFPSNKNKWSVFSAFEYHSKYKSIKQVPTKNIYFGGVKNSYAANGSYSTPDWSVDYNYFDFGFGLRHYMFLDDNSKFFLNVSGNYSVDFDSKVKNNYYSYDSYYATYMPTQSYVYRIKNNFHFGYGLGYCYKKYSIELEYSSIGNILKQNGGTVKGRYQDFSITLGYILFESNK